MIGQAANFNADPSQNKPGANVKLSAGMQKGLPLANPKQAGLILQGTILQAFGNWQGVNQTLELICNPVGLSPDLGFCFYWKAGTPIATAIASVLTQAMPGYTQKITVSPHLVLSHDEAGTYDNIFQFAGFLQEMTESLGVQIYGNNYSGVLLTITGNTVFAHDNANPREAIQLEFTDLIGQPTWINPATVSFKTVLRSDIAVNDRIKFPQKGLVTPYVLTTQNAAFPNAPSRVRSIFQGTFTVNEVHHFANFRQPDADSWVTAFKAVAGLPATPNLLSASLGL
jgi:hypothetical protein